MKKIILVLLIASTTIGAANAATTFYDSYGHSIGRAETFGDTTTYYNSYGHPIGRATTWGN
jgi:YD repeat-containing protein